MNGQPYKKASIRELERPDGWSPVRRALGVRAFGVNAWTARAAGDTVIGEHTERQAGHEELYLVVAGRATFTVDGEEVDAPAGTVVFVPEAESRRGAVAAEPGTVVFTVGGTRGEAYAARPWESSQEVAPAFEGGDYEGAKRLLLAALAEYSEQAEIRYNLACAEAQLGQTDAAFGHLRLAVAEMPSLAESGRVDDDLAPLRDDPRFAEILNV